MMGKFEGEPAWVEYFWNEGLDGGGTDISVGICDESWANAWYFEADADEAERFGLKVGESIMLVEDGQGFIVSWRGSEWLDFNNERDAYELLAHWAGARLPMWDDRGNEP